LIVARLISSRLYLGDHDISPQLERCQEAIGLLDLVVLAPIEQPERIPVSQTRI
jgi:hypothetical protein